MAKHIAVTQLCQGQLDPVRMGQQIFKSVQGTTHEAVCLVELGASMATRLSRKLNRLFERTTNMGGRGIPPVTIIRDIVLQRIASIVAGDI
jgi:hypothetical protein